MGRIALGVMSRHVRALGNKRTSWNKAWDDGFGAEVTLQRAQRHGFMTPDTPGWQGFAIPGRMQCHVAPWDQDGTRIARYETLDAALLMYIFMCALIELVAFSTHVHRRGASRHVFGHRSEFADP